MVLTELGIKDIWVKTRTPEHGRLAQRIGAHHVVYSEADMGERVAHLITGRMMDFIEFEDGFAIAKIHAPDGTHHQPLAECHVRSRYGVTVVRACVPHLTDGRVQMRHAAPTVRAAARGRSIPRTPP